MYQDVAPARAAGFGAIPAPPSFVVSLGSLARRRRHVRRLRARPATRTAWVSAAGS
ncbi:FAS1-like dehydratase domain-containing protein, partial [Enterococcus faecium]